MKCACDSIAMDCSGERQACSGNEMMLAKLSLSGKTSQLVCAMFVREVIYGESL